MEMSFLISLNNPLFKNMPNVGSFWHLVISCIFVFVYLYFCTCAFDSCLCIRHHIYDRGHHLIYGNISYEVCGHDPGMINRALEVIQIFLRTNGWTEVFQEVLADLKTGSSIILHLPYKIQFPYFTEQLKKSHKS